MIGAAVAACAVIGAIVAVGGVAASSKTAVAPSSGCHLANGIQHVVEITFDNVHFNRDNPNVLSDLEQMPALLSFVTGEGTMLSNNHTPLIAHTADDSITNYSGLYGDRHGQGITNSYETYVGGTPVSKSSFAYWTGAYGLDSYPNQPYSANVPATGTPPSTPPAPWVPFTRAGCDVGDVSTANMVIENLTPDLANIFGGSSPEVAQLNADPSAFKDQEVNDYEGLAVHCAQLDSFCSSAQAIKFGQASPSSTAVTDSLPDEPGGYGGFQALFGHKYLQPQLKGAANSGSNRVVGGHTYPVYDAAGNLVDLSGNEIVGQFTKTSGFPGFGPISAAQTLAYMADMQEAGVPVTLGYISDAHERKPGQSGCSNSGTAQGPGDTCYEQTLAAYNQAFTTFFQRLADDGITARNTLFVITADEGDHFAGANVGRALDPTSGCTGTPDTSSYTCSYPKGTIGEQAVNIHGLLANQLADTTAFYNEPQGNAVYINGNPGPTTTTTRQLERDFADVTANNAYDGNVPENVSLYLADPAVEQLLHFVNADANRTPSFTVFPRPDYFLTIGASDSCPAGTTQANAAANCSSLNNGFAWNHGYYAPEIDNTWLGLVGPGVANKGVDGSSAADGPSSADGSNSNPKLVTALTNPGTWADHTDIRPTINALTGLKDDYVDDGRVLTEDLTVIPGKTGDAGFQPLAACYKQLNASVGQFGTDVLLADTAVLPTGSIADDSIYTKVLLQIQALGSDRDALATEIKNDLFDAEFENTSIPSSGSLLARCESILRQADQVEQAASVVNGNLSCENEELRGMTINGNLAVPPGSTCRLIGSTVNGNVQLQTGGALLDGNSTIGGNVQATNAAWIDLRGGTIRGNLQALGTTGVPPGSTLDGATANDLCGATVNGNVQVQGSGPGAPFDIGGAPDCSAGLAVAGNLQVQNNAGRLAIAGNTVHGNIQVQNNTGGGSLTNNKASGNCQLQNDSPGIAGSANTAAGNSTCNRTA